MENAEFERRMKLGVAFATTHLWPLIPQLRRLQLEHHADCEWAIPPRLAAAAEIGSGALFYALPIAVDAAVTVPTVRLVDPIRDYLRA